MYFIFSFPALIKVSIAYDVFYFGRDRKFNKYWPNKIGNSSCFQGESDEPDYGLIGTYKVLVKMLKMPRIQELVAVLLTCKVS